VKRPFCNPLLKRPSAS